jgi:hypothetical protein
VKIKIYWLAVALISTICFFSGGIEAGHFLCRWFKVGIELGGSSGGEDDCTKLISSGIIHGYAV